MKVVIDQENVKKGQIDASTVFMGKLAWQVWTWQCRSCTFADLVVLYLSNINSRPMVCVEFFFLPAVLVFKLRDFINASK